MSSTMNKKLNLLLNMKHEMLLIVERPILQENKAQRSHIWRNSEEASIFAGLENGERILRIRRSTI